MLIIRWEQVHTNLSPIKPGGSQADQIRRLLRGAARIKDVDYQIITDDNTATVNFTYWGM